jgi:imidazolonepropionase-like amidohydrolase
LRTLSILLVLALATAARADTLIRGATILPQDAPPFEGSVLVHDDQIVAVGAHLDAPDGAEVIDARGLFLIPGLIDAHAHVAEEKILPDLFVPHGVTTVRDMGNRLETVEKLSLDLSPGRPEILYVGPILDGNPPVWPLISEVVEDPAKVPALLARLKERGARWFKVYEHLHRDVYDAIIAEAKKLGIPVIGHVPESVGVFHCVEAGQDTLEHLDHFPAALAKTGTVAATGFESEITGWNDVDEAKEKELIAALLAHKTKLDPTRFVIRNLSLALRGCKIETPGVEFIPRMIQDTFWGFFAGRPRADAATDARHEAGLARALEFVKKASAAGVPILCGSDTPNPWVVPGASVHEEIAELAKALGPEKALACATLENARALGRDDLGRIAKGTRADLVLLSKDPRKDAAAVRAIEGVMVRGTFHGREWLRATRKALAERARSMDEEVATGFEAIPGPLSDRRPLLPEWRFEGRLGDYPPSFWLRMRVFEGPEGGRMIFLRSRGAIPVPVTASEELVLDKEDRVVRYHMATDTIGTFRETTIERTETSWRVQLFQAGEKKLEVSVPLDQTPEVRGELLFYDLVSKLDLDVGGEKPLQLRFVDLDQLKVEEPTTWTIRRRKNPVEGGEGPRGRARYFVAAGSDPAAGRLGAWIGEGREPLAFEVQLPFGKFTIARIAAKKKYY